MSLVICVASNRANERFDRMVTEINQCIYEKLFLTILVNTGEPYKKFFLGPDNFKIREVRNMPRLYASVMYEKIQTVREYCDDETILISLDDDYSLNPYALQFIETVMTENPEINYLSCLRGPGVMVEEKDTLEVNGFRMFRHFSCMGGSLCVRWKTFQPMIDVFFQEHNVSGEDSGTAGMWDWCYWEWLSRQTGEKNNVYTTLDFSLYQHCLLGSAYQREKMNKWEIMRGENFDPVMNPFEIRDKE